MGLPALGEATGRDLSAYLRGGPAPPGAKLLTLHQQSALRGSDWKVILNHQTGFATYYDLEADPDEQQPLAVRTAAPERLRMLEAAEAAAAAHAERLAWSEATDAELDPALRERLRELGYVE